MSPETDKPSRFENPNAAPAADPGFAARRLPGVPAGEHKGMLPGMAMIGIYMLVLAMVNAFAAARDTFGNGPAKYTILSICTLLVIGVFGMLRLRRWGWALVTGGTICMAGGFFFGFHKTHAGPYIIQALFALCFFLYLIRTEVRDHLRA